VACATSLSEEPDPPLESPRPRILFFDEATSALDKCTQAIAARVKNGANGAISKSCFF
jgi:ABC-type hemin transport system ATPase subunit